MERNDNTRTLAGCLVMILTIGFSFIVTLLVTFWTDRTLDFWCTYFAHHTINIPFWLSFMLTALFNVITIALNIISEIVRLCL